MILSKWTPWGTLMKSSVRLKPVWWDALIVGTCVFGAIACYIYLWSQNTDMDNNTPLVAVITVSGNEMERVALTGTAELSVSNNGYTLEISFCPDGNTGVCVVSSDCPGQDCHRAGTITKAGESIICLPAQISIQLEYSNMELENDIDAVIG